MPHDKRQRKTKRPDPKQNRPLFFSDEETLEAHRELRLLAVAGRAKPGRRRDELLTERMEKLDEVQGRRLAREEAVTAKEGARVAQEREIQRTLREARYTRLKWERKGKPEHSCFADSTVKAKVLLVCSSCGATVRLQEDRKCDTI